MEALLTAAGIADTVTDFGSRRNPSQEDPVPESTKSIFITGAGSGMGRAGAELFHGRGWRVAAVDRNTDGLTSLAVDLGPDRVWTRRVDVTDRAALEAAVSDFCAENPGGGLDMMWNNAG